MKASNLVMPQSDNLRVSLLCCPFSFFLFDYHSIDFETAECEFEKARVLYERLLHRTKHLKVWISYPDFEATAIDESLDLSEQEQKEQCIKCARRVFEEALNYFRSSAPDLKEERAMLLEKWLNLEASSGELGDVSLVQSKLPKKLKKRRQISTEGGSSRKLIGGYVYVYGQVYAGWLMFYTHGQKNPSVFIQEGRLNK